MVLHSPNRKAGVVNMAKSHTAVHIVISNHAKTRFFADYGQKPSAEILDGIRNELTEFAESFGRYANKFLEYCERKDNRIKITPTIEVLVMTVYQHDILLVVVRYIKIIGKATQQQVKASRDLTP